MAPFHTSTTSRYIFSTISLTHICAATANVNKTVCPPHPRFLLGCQYSLAWPDGAFDPRLADTGVLPGNPTPIDNSLARVYDVSTRNKGTSYYNKLTLRQLSALKIMSKFILWDSQPFEVWASKHAQGQFIDLDGCTTHYIEKGDGEPLILLHGFFYDSYIWADNIDVLAEKFKVYALDLWGFGYSTRKPLNYGYQLYADQVLKFMDSLGIQSASLVGQSMGGGTAILFCVQHRQRVNKLLLVDPAALPHTLPLIGKIFNIPRVGEFFMGLSTNVVRKKNLGDVWIYNKKLLTQGYFDNVTRFQKIQGTTEVLAAILRKEFFHTLSNEVHQLSQEDVPILIVWGREDKANPLRLGQDMHRILKNSRLEVIDNAGHVPNYECSDVFNRLALDFLQE